MAQLLTGTRIYGTGTVDTQLFVSGTNSATSTTTGALQVVGGVGVGGNLHVGGIIYGAILGTATTATNADNIKTVLQTASATYYPAFVDSNNSTAAYEALYTTSSFVINPQSGFVGIGTASPSTKLHVYENSAADVALRLTPANGSYDALLQMTGANGAIATEGFEIWYSNTVGDVRIATTYPNDAAAIRFHTRTGASKSTSNERLTIAGNGNVGIGTNSPSYLLHLLTTSTTSAAFRNSTSTTTQILIGNTAGDTTIRTLGSGDSFIFSDTSKYLAFGTGATERLRITANGGISFGASGTAYGVSGQILQSNGDAAPTWISTGSLAAANATTATHLSGGTAGQIPYQTAPGVTSFYGPGTAGNVLVSNGTSAPSYNNTLTLAGTTAATSTATGTLVVVGGVGIGDNLFVNNNINAVSGQFVSTRANNTSTGAGQIYLNGASGNRIDFNQNGVAAPAFTTRSAGTKLVLYSNLSGSAVDYAIGIESSSLWSSVPNTGSFFKWYGATTLAATLTGAGNLTLVGDLAVNGGDITTTQATFNLINTTATTVNFAGSATTLTMGASGSGTTNVRNNLTVSGNLTVQGTTTIVDSTVTNIADPIITLGGGTGNTAPIADDNKDRGVAFKWVNDGGTTSTGFFGYDDSTGYFTYVQTATITNEVVSGTKGAMDVNLAGGSAMAIVYQSAADTTAFLAAGSSGYLLQTNGTGSAPTWVSASGVSAGSATNADNIRTILQTGNATHFLTFVDSNNASHAYESLYTTSSFAINPQSGNVGIGTSTATYALTIVNSSPVLSVGNLANTGGSIYLGNSNHGVNRGGASGSNDVSLYTTAGNLYLSANGLATTSHLTVSNTGNVNIGTFTTSISKKFTVVGEGNFTDASNVTRLYMGWGTIPGTGGSGAYIYNADNSPLAFGTTNTERMRISTTGDVGIGTTNPTYRLTITTSTNSATTTASTIALHLFNLATDGNISQPGRVGIGFGASSTRSAIVAGTYGNDYLDFYTAGDITTPRIRIRSTGAIAFSGTNTHGSSGYVLKSNGDAAPTWVDPSTLASASATNADNIRTVRQTANASYFPAFVDSNNASNAYELVYTTSSFSINPATGFVGIGSQDGASPLNVKVLSTLSGTINSFQKVLTTQAAGGLGNNVYRSEWRRRRAAGTDWTTQNIFDGIWVDSSYTTPGTDTRTWWDRDPATPSQAWGDQATTWMFHNSSALFLTGGSSQLNTGFTNRLNVSGAIVAGSASSTNGSIILQGQYGTGSITNFGTEYSSGGPVISYGVYPSNAGTGAFFSSSGAALTRAAYTQAGNVHNWYVGASQTVAIGSAATLALAMTLNSTGALAFNGASNYGTSGQLLKSNGNTSPTWVDQSTVVSGQVSTVLQTASASYFPTFVDSNNASAAAESLYTTSSFSINPQSGNIGIGTNSPSFKLDVVGTIRSNLSTTGTLYLGQTSAGTLYTAAALVATPSTLYAPIGRLSFQLPTHGVSTDYGLTEQMFIEGTGPDSKGAYKLVMLPNGGNVGIGTSSPGYPLVVQTIGTSSSPTPQGSNIALRLQSTQTNYAVSLQFSDNVTNAAFITMQGGGFRFTTSNPGSVQAMNISSGGNVSIGTTSTTNKFEVAGTAGQLFSVSDSFTGTIFSANDVSGIPSIEVLDTGLVKLAQYNGAVAIGTGTITSSTAELSVYGMLYTLGSQGEIRASSEITAYFSSDQRLKENIKLIENPITIIDQIRGVTFDWTDEHMARRGGEDGYFVRKHDIGVIAQEVQAVLPELVGTREDGYLAVKYEKMVPLLIEAIKAQQKTIDSLAKDLDDVKEFINDLKNKNGI